MAELFKAFLLTSAVGTVLALGLVLLKPITQKHFSARWHYYIWLVVLFIMICPVRLDVPQTPMAVMVEMQAIEIHPNAQFILQPVQTEAPSVFWQFKAFTDNNVVVLSYIWIFGALLLLLLRLLNYMIFLIRMHRYTKIISCPEAAQYTKRKIKTRTSEIISSPLVVGVFKPTLLLPPIALSQEQLHNILSHEMTHLNRNDLLYKWFAGLVKCLCWYNPMIYFIIRQINIECEISCDLSATEKMNDEEKKSYIETILSLLTHNKSRAVPLTTAMAGDKKILKKRFYMIKNKMKISKRVAVLSGVIAVMILITTFSVSGVLNGSIFKTYNNSIVELNTEKAPENNFNLLSNLLDNKTANTVDNDIVFEKVSEIANNIEADTNNNNDKSKLYENNITTSKEAVNSLAVQKTPTRIKSSEVSSELYGGFEQVVIENATTQGIENTLIQNGITKSHINTADLSKNYIVNKYNYKDSLKYDYSGVHCDSNGNISIYFTVNVDNLVDIQFYDSQTKEDVGGYGILANNENAYTFIGFDPNKTYDISIQGKTKDTWKIDGEYIIY